MDLQRLQCQQPKHNLVAGQRNRKMTITQLAIRKTSHMVTLQISHLSTGLANQDMLILTSLLPNSIDRPPPAHTLQLNQYKVWPISICLTWDKAPLSLPSPTSRFRTPPLSSTSSSVTTSQWKPQLTTSCESKLKPSRRPPTTRATTNQAWRFKNSSNKSLSQRRSRS